MQRGTVNFGRMGYDIRTLITLSISLLFVCGMVELLSTYNYETMENESVVYTSLGHRTTSVVSNRRNNIEMDLMPISELESKCDINLYDMNRQVETSSDNITTTAYTNIDVEYWFAVGTTANKFSDLSLFQLHQYVYTSVQESNIWCTSSVTASSDSNSTTTSKLGTITFIPVLLVPSTNGTLRFSMPGILSLEIHCLTIFSLFCASIEHSKCFVKRRPSFLICQKHLIQLSH